MIPFRLRKYRNAPFHGDAVWQNVVRELSEILDFTSCVETGTLKADTTLFLGEVFPKLPIFTIEISKEYAKESKWRLRKFPNAQVLRGSSSEVLSRLVEENKLGGFPLFFLDAHAGVVPPLNNELKAVNRLEKAIVMIDDFKVPGKPEFKFNTYTTREKDKVSLDFNFIKKNLRAGKHCILVPDYSRKEAGNMPPNKLRGHVIICQNLSEAEWGKILRTATVNRHYIVHAS